jgi:hypothetical protein
MVGSIASVLGAIAAALAAIGSWASAHAVQRATEAQLLAMLMNEYSSDEMLKAIQELTGWADHHRDNLANELRRRKTTDLFGPSRRRVSHYFQKVHTLCQQKLINEATVRALVKEDQARLYIDIVEPLEEVHNARYDDKSFRALGRLYHLTKRRLPPKEDSQMDAGLGGRTGSPLPASPLKVTIDRVYRELAEDTRYHLNWRERLLLGFVAVPGGLALVYEKPPSQYRWMIPLAGFVLSMAIF